MEDASNRLTLYWDSTFAIAVALMTFYPECKPDDVGLVNMAEMIQRLPGFVDDPELVNERILLDIQTVWYEEMTEL